MSVTSNLVEHIEQNVSAFLATGVAMLAMHSNYPRFSLKRLLRDVAKEHKRPFIWVDRVGVGSVDLHIPKVKGTNLLVAGLLLVADEDKNKYYRGHGGSGVRLISGSNFWEFRFIGPADVEIFDAWLEQCRTDKIFKVALKLP